MSSKLHRGGSSLAESMAWPNTAAPARTARPADDPDDRVAALQREGEERAQAAYRKGLADGDASARQQLTAQVGATLTRLARSIEELSGLRRRFRQEAEADLVKLALAIARRILHRELTVDSDALSGIVKSALNKIDSRELHSIRIHPDYAAGLRGQLDQIGLPSRVELIPDPALEHGAVIFDTARGALDASVQTQLAEIDRGFVDLVRAL